MNKRKKVMFAYIYIYISMKYGEFLKYEVLRNKSVWFSQFIANLRPVSISENMQE